MGRGRSKAGDRASGGATQMVLQEMTDSANAVEKAGLKSGTDYNYDYSNSTYNITASGLKKLKKSGYSDRYLKIMQRGSTLKTGSRATTLAGRE